jgi:hypothetical protein
MGLDKEIWGGEIQKEFEIKIKNKDRKIVLRALNTEDTLGMDLNTMTRENSDTKAILQDAVQILSRSIVSIDGQVPDSPEETRDFLMKSTQPGDIFNLLGKFQTLTEVIEQEVKN